MATIGSASRPSATILCSAVLLVLLIAAATPAGASQLNLYKGKWCTGSFTVCWDLQCCNITDDAVSYRFYYNPDWKAYLFANTSCSGSANSTLASDYSCVQGVDFKSVMLSDSSSIRQVTAEE
ncbi:hypothetical protein Taro_050087 [Colocasia esculenta]|uniref:Uncharacterized protein n=1 Tax=Colocasia esculenta TaxID=4460 RepID=A0A843XCI1_COLES|nr:hypothetical protein [Colocasia esculenta]